MTNLNNVEQALQVYAMIMIGFALCMLVFTIAIDYKRS